MTVVRGMPNVSLQKIVWANLPLRPTETLKGLPSAEGAMPVPAITYYQGNTSKARRFDPYAVAIVGGGVLLSIGLWALAIAKIIDLLGLH
jgi:hypothetical protein